MASAGSKRFPVRDALSAMASRGRSLNNLSNSALVTGPDFSIFPFSTVN